MKALSVARKTLLEYLREPLLLVFYYLAFGETDQGLAKFLNVWHYSKY